MVLYFRKLMLLLLILIVALSCTTKDGVSPEAETFDLWVKTNGVTGARIFLDHRDTGLLTPGLLSKIPVGDHVLHVFAGHFSNTPDSIVISGTPVADSVSFTLKPKTGGDLIVRSDPDSARVFINSLEFGVTPLVVEGLQAGEHNIKLLKSNYDVVFQTVSIAANDSASLLIQLQEDLRNFVLLEHFSNSGCVPCVPVDELVDELATEYGVDELVFLSYHAGTPDPGDPMYLAAKEIVNARFNYYSALYTPRSYVGGEVLSNPRDKSKYIEKITEQLAADTLATIAFQQVNRGQTNLSGVLQVESLKQFPANCKIHIMLIEDDVNFSQAPGINGLKHFTFVVRDFTADINGQDCNLSLNEKKQFNFDFAEINRWGSDITVIAFLQDEATKKIIQSGWTKYPEF